MRVLAPVSRRLSCCNDCRYRTAQPETHNVKVHDARQERSMLLYCKRTVRLAADGHQH
jgi:hypothetical protein